MERTRRGPPTKVTAQLPYAHCGSTRHTFTTEARATLSDVVVHYNRVRTLGFTAAQQGDLVEYLKSR